MLPTARELREQSRRFRDAAAKARESEMRQKLVAQATELSRIAEVLEHHGERLRPETRGEFERLLARLLGEKMQQIVQALLSESLPLPDPQSQARNWRARAEELRSIADAFVVPSVQEVLRRAAASYDQIADEVEARPAGSGHKPRDEAG